MRGRLASPVPHGAIVLFSPRLFQAGNLRVLLVPFSPESGARRAFRSANISAVVGFPRVESAQ